MVIKAVLKKRAERLWQESSDASVPPGGAAPSDGYGGVKFPPIIVLKEPKVPKLRIRKPSTLGSLPAIQGAFKAKDGRHGKRRAEAGAGEGEAGAGISEVLITEVGLLVDTPRIQFLQQFFDDEASSRVPCFFFETARGTRLDPQAVVERVRRSSSSSVPSSSCKDPLDVACLRFQAAPGRDACTAALLLCEAFPSLTALHLRACHLRSTGAELLAAALYVVSGSGLAHLDLEDNSIGPKGGAALARGIPACAALRSLGLARNILGANGNVEGCRELAAALHECKSMTSLDLSCNYIGSKGAMVLAKGGVFGLLAVVNLNGNRIRFDGAKAIAAALDPRKQRVFSTSLAVLNIAGNEIGVKGAEALIAAAAQRTGPLRLCGRMAEAHPFDLSGRGLGAADAILLAHDLAFVQAHTLLLSRNNFGDAVFARNGKVKEVRDAWEGFAALSEALQGSTGIRWLDVSRNQMGPCGARVLARALKTNTSLTHLDLCHNDLCPEVKKKWKRPQLQERADRRRRVSEADYIPDTDQQDQRGIAALTTALVANKSITHLDISHTGIGEQEVLALAQGLGDNPSLKVMNLWGNLLGAEGAEKVTWAASQRSTPVKLCGALLDVEALDLRGQGLQPVDAVLLAHDLGFNTALRTLLLRTNDIGGYQKAEGTRALAAMLHKNTTLRTLDLSDNDLHVYDAKILAQGAGASPSLESMNIWENPIGVEGAQEVAEVASDRVKPLRLCGGMMDVQVLNLSGQELTATDAVLLGHDMKLSTALQVLDLRNNDNLVGNAATAIADAVLARPADLWVSFNGIPLFELKTKGMQWLNVKDLNIGAVGGMVLGRWLGSMHGGMVAAEMVDRLKTTDVTSHLGDHREHQKLAFVKKLRVNSGTRRQRNVSFSNRILGNPSGGTPSSSLEVTPNTTPRSPRKTPRRILQGVDGFRKTSTDHSSKTTPRILEES